MLSATKLLSVCCPSVAGYKGIHVAEIQATCCQQQKSNMLPDNMLPWCKRGLRTELRADKQVLFVVSRCWMTGRYLSVRLVVWRRSLPFCSSVFHNLSSRVRLSSRVNERHSITKHTVTESISLDLPEATRCESRYYRDAMTARCDRSITGIL